MDRATLEARIGAEETARYFARFERCRAANDYDVGEAYGVPTGEFDLLPPEALEELTGRFRPGLLAFAEESAGDYLVWDLRRGRAGAAPSVLRCNHELGLLEDPTSKEMRGLCIIPSTHVPLLEPEKTSCLDEALPRYEEAIEVFRELIDAESRAQFRAELADTLRHYADVLLRRERWSEAAKAAGEASALYTSRATSLANARSDADHAFCERALATVAARERDFERAYAHAAAALDLAERFERTQRGVLRAAASAVEGWAMERSGAPKDEVKLRLKNAQKWAEPYRAQFPVAEQIASIRPRKKKNKKKKTDDA